MWNLLPQRNPCTRELLHMRGNRSIFAVYTYFYSLLQMSRLNQKWAKWVSISLGWPYLDLIFWILIAAPCWSLTLVTQLQQLELQAESWLDSSFHHEFTTECQTESSWWQSLIPIHLPYVIILREAYIPSTKWWNKYHHDFIQPSIWSSGVILLVITYNDNATEKLIEFSNFSWKEKWKFNEILLSLCEPFILRFSAGKPVIMSLRRFIHDFSPPEWCRREIIRMNVTEM